MRLLLIITGVIAFIGCIFFGIKDNDPMAFMIAIVLIVNMIPLFMN